MKERQYNFQRLITMKLMMVMMMTMMMIYLSRVDVGCHCLVYQGWVRAICCKPDIPVTPGAGKERLAGRKTLLPPQHATQEPALTATCGSRHAAGDPLPAPLQCLPARPFSGSVTLGAHWGVARGQLEVLRADRNVARKARRKASKKLSGASTNPSPSSVGSNS